MDSQGRSVIVCDNGTGVSLLTEKIQFQFWVGQLSKFTDNMKMYF